MLVRAIAKSTEFTKRLDHFDSDWHHHFGHPRKSIPIHLRTVTSGVGDLTEKLHGGESRDINTYIRTERIEIFVIIS